eukprot:Skav225759  [mRNA]  locus=scaffold3552:41058:47848:+ [translate_table: standard]
MTAAAQSATRPKGRSLTDNVLLGILDMVCPQFTCASEGKCSWSAAEIRDAVGSGADNVVEKVTSTAANIPGLADAAGAVQGVWNTVGGVVGSIFGATGGCSGYVGLCWGQCSNQQQLGYTASCQYVSDGLVRNIAEWLALSHTVSQHCASM